MKAALCVIVGRGEKSWRTRLAVLRLPDRGDDRSLYWESGVHFLGRVSDLAALPLRDPSSCSCVLCPPRSCTFGRLDTIGADWK